MALGELVGHVVERERGVLVSQQLVAEREVEVERELLTHVHRRVLDLNGDRSSLGVGVGLALELDGGGVEQRAVGKLVAELRFDRLDMLAVALADEGSRRSGSAVPLPGRLAPIVAKRLELNGVGVGEGLAVEFDRGGEDVLAALLAGSGRGLQGDDRLEGAARAVLLALEGGGGSRRLAVGVPGPGRLAPDVLVIERDLGAAEEDELFLAHLVLRVELLGRDGDGAGAALGKLEGQDDAVGLDAVQIHVGQDIVAETLGLIQNALVLHGGEDGEQRRGGGIVVDDDLAVVGQLVGLDIDGDLGVDLLNVSVAAQILDAGQAADVPGGLFGLNGGLGSDGLLDGLFDRNGLFDAAIHQRLNVGEERSGGVKQVFLVRGGAHSGVEAVAGIDAALVKAGSRPDVICEEAGLVDGAVVVDIIDHDDILRVLVEAAPVQADAVVVQGGEVRGVSRVADRADSSRSEVCVAPVIRHDAH